jgi:sensor histidine kinase YesM
MLYLVRLLILFAGYLTADLLLNVIIAKFSLSVFVDNIYWFSVAKRLMFVFYPSAILFAIIANIISQKQQSLSNEKELAELRLENLQKQIQPHFLFNTLNSIYSTSLKENATQTSSLLEQFADILRYSTTKGVGPISLTEEMRFLECYISLQKTRLRENEEILSDINITHGELTIYPLLLQPFIENGFKFGFLHEGGAVVSISINEKNNILQLIVHNSLPRIEQPNDGLSIGMKNTIGRLDLLYPGKYKLIKRSENNEYLIQLTINLNHG